MSGRMDGWMDGFIILRLVLGLSCHGLCTVSDTCTSVMLLIATALASATRSSSKSWSYLSFGASCTSRTRTFGIVISELCCFHAWFHSASCRLHRVIACWNPHSSFSCVFEHGATSIVDVGCLWFSPLFSTCCTNMFVIMCFHIHCCLCSCTHTFSCAADHDHTAHISPSRPRELK